MKIKFVLVATALLMSAATFAQKEELKAAEKALKSGSPQDADKILKDAEGLIANATPEQKSHYNFLLGKASLDLANKDVEAGKNLSAAATSFQNVILIEKESGKSKYSAQATTSIIELKAKLINSAIADTKVNKFNDGGKKLYDAYLLDKKDTINLYYSADCYISGKDYKEAISKYEELKKINYSGKSTNYEALNKSTNAVEFFGSKTERDFAVKMTTHTAPKDVKVPSKKGEIYKNYALLLNQEGRSEEAKKAFADAINANPDDSSLTLGEANLYLDLKEFDTYKKKIELIVAKNPNDAILLFNLGTLSSKTDPIAAEKYFLRAIEIKPDYVDALLNLSILKLDGEKKIIDEMSALKNTEKDNKRYDVLNKQKNDIYRTAMPYLEKANEVDPKNKDVATTLSSIYGALEMTEKKKALKARSL